VAGVEPTISEDRGGLLRLLPVPVHQIGAAKAELPRLASVQFAGAGLDVDDLALDVRHRDTHGAGLPDSFARVGVRHGRRLGEAISLEHLAAGELLEASHDLD